MCLVVPKSPLLPSGYKGNVQAGMAVLTIHFGFLYFSLGRNKNATHCHELDFIK